MRDASGGWICEREKEIEREREGGEIEVGKGEGDRERGRISEKETEKEKVRRGRKERDSCLVYCVLCEMRCPIVSRNAFISQSAFITSNDVISQTPNALDFRVLPNTVIVVCSVE